jgi:superoxide reductase
MCKEQKFFICKHCGNIIGMIHASGVPVVCCGENMTELVANTSDGAYEKHVPVVEVDGSLVTVTVGSVLHPMLPEHHIAWVYLKTAQGGQRKCLEVGAVPKVTFALCDGDVPLTAFEYCNLHGLWKADVK